jgi:hypothetical protein
MILNQYRRAVGAFAQQADAEAALKKLVHLDFPMHQISIIAPTTNKVSDKVETQTHQVFTDPGALALGGALAPMLSNLLAEGTLGHAREATSAMAETLLNALVTIGIPENRAKIYRNCLSRGDYLVIVDGTESQIQDAKSVFGRRNIQEWEVYDAPETYANGISTAAVQSANRDRMPDQHASGASAYEAETGMLNSSNRHHTSDLAHAPRTHANKSSLSALYQTDADSSRGRHRHAIGIFSTYQETANALEELRQADFPMKRVSVIVRDAARYRDIVGVGVKRQVGNRASQGLVAGAIAGSALGGILGLQSGLGTWPIPGLDSVLLVNAEVTPIITTLIGAGFGAILIGLIGALIGAGIWEDRAKNYSDYMTRGHYLVLIKGTGAEIRNAQAILHRREIIGQDSTPNGGSTS